MEDTIERVKRELEIEETCNMHKEQSRVSGIHTVHSQNSSQFIEQ
jgi:hypothetical protein